MGDETVAGLVKDLAAQLASIADNFGSRADILLARDETSASATAGDGDKPAIVARRLLLQRTIRLQHLPAELFHEPAWDMLLALYVAQNDRQVMNVKTLVATASAPVTTSQRWIDHLHKLQLIDRVVDPMDRRRMEISLSSAGNVAIENYLAAIGASA